MTHWISRWLTPSGPPEVLMLKYSQTGKPALLDALVNACGDDLYHYLLSHSVPPLAADLSQSTWLKVIEKRRYYQHQGQFKSWLFTLARNLMIDHLRQSNRWQTLTVEGNDPISHPLHKHAIDQQALDRFNHILARLPFLQKEAFMLQQEGFCLTEIAEITGDNSEVIKSRLRYAMNNLRQLLQMQQPEAS